MHEVFERDMSKCNDMKSMGEMAAACEARLLARAAARAAGVKAAASDEAKAAVSAEFGAVHAEAEAAALPSRVEAAAPAETEAAVHAEAEAAAPARAPRRRCKAKPPTPIQTCDDFQETCVESISSRKSAIGKRFERPIWANNHVMV